MIAHRKKAAALAFALVLAAGPVAAQVGGGGGGGGAGWLSGLWTTFLTNVAPGIGIFAIAFLGILALGLRIGLIVIVGVVVGIYVIVHADTIYNLISGG